MTKKLARPPNYKDRPCDTCSEPMVGIMKVSGKLTPRKVCCECQSNFNLDQMGESNEKANS